jgi:hypothetical protein
LHENIRHVKFNAGVKSAYCPQQSVKVYVYSYLQDTIDNKTKNLLQVLLTHGSPVSHANIAGLLQNPPRFNGISEQKQTQNINRNYEITKLVVPQERNEEKTG